MSADQRKPIDLVIARCAAFWSLVAMSDDDSDPCAVDGGTKTYHALHALMLAEFRQGRVLDGRSGGGVLPAEYERQYDIVEWRHS